MIKYVDMSHDDDLKSVCRYHNTYSCRIMCLFDSYGLNFDGVQFWVQYNDELPVSAISKYNTDITVMLTEKSDIAELSEFLKVVGFSSVLSDKVIFDDQPYSTGVVMALSQNTANSAESEISGDLRMTDHPNLKEVYRLLSDCRDSDFIVPSYEDFMLDTSHKLRHGTAKCTSVFLKEKCIAYAMTVAQSDTCAVIGAVAVQKEYRRRGIGSICAKALCGQLKDREIFIMRDKSRNEEFYRSLGFENIGEFVIIRN